MKPDRPPMNEELQKRIDAYMIQRMAERLELTEEQRAKLEPLVGRLEAERRQFMRERMERVRALAQKMRDGSVADADIDRELSELRQLERDHQDRHRKQEDDVLALLSPRQRVRYLVFRQKFAQEIRRKLKELHEERGLPPGGLDRPHPGRPPAPAGEGSSGDSLF